MAWPVVDILPPPASIGAEWVYTPAPALSLSAQSTASWSSNVVRRWGVPIVPHLYAAQLGATYRVEHLYAHLDGAVAAWNGPVGLANPRLVVGYTNDRVVMQAAATAPLSMFNDLVGARAWAYDASVSVAGSWSSVTLGSVYRGYATEYWQPSSYAVVGMRYRAWTVEARGEVDLKANRVGEAAVSYGLRGRCWRTRPSVAVGLTKGIGTPAVRVRATVEYGCGLKPPTVAMEFVESHLWIEAEQSGPLPLAEAPKSYPTAHESIGGFLTANPMVRVYIRTNLSETQAQRALSVFVAKGLSMSQVERTDYVSRIAGEPLYLDFVVIRGNKNAEAKDAPVEVVP